MKTIYYEDELNDDFAATQGIKTKPLQIMNGFTKVPFGILLQLFFIFWLFILW